MARLFLALRGQQTAGAAIAIVAIVLGTAFFLVGRTGGAYEELIPVHVREQLQAHDDGVAGLGVGVAIGIAGVMLGAWALAHNQPSEGRSSAMAAALAGAIIAAGLLAAAFGIRTNPSLVLHRADLRTIEQTMPPGFSAEVVADD